MTNPQPPVSDTSNALRDFFKRWPRFYYFIAVVFGPMYMGGLSAEGFLKTYRLKGTIANLGSGPKVLRKDVLNVDSTAYPGVSLVADISDLPLKEGSVDGIVCDTVLEHVASPSRVIQEMHRILAPGGYAYITVPFLYPFHASPDDFHRWTEKGLRLDLAAFDIERIGVRSGPFSALTVQLCYITATLFSFGSEALYWFLVNLSMFVFFPLKFLDALWIRFPRAADSASILYVVVCKP